MKRQTILLPLVALAIAAMVGCGTPSVPTFTKVPFVSNRTVTPATYLFTAHLDGSSVTPIPFTSTSVWDLSISADGKTAVFLSNSSGTTGILVENTDGTGQKQLTTAATPYWARISPSGKKIVYHDSTYHISVINPDGTGNVDLTPTLPTGMSQCYDPSFSGDSSQVAFVCYSSSPSSYSIFTMKVDGTGLKTVETRSGSNWADFAWLTPDGKKVVFIGGFNGASGVGSVNIDGTGEALLVANQDELIVLNSNLFYANTCSSTRLIFKSNLDGTGPVQISDNTNSSDLFWPGGGC